MIYILGTAAVNCREGVARPLDGGKGVEGRAVAEAGQVTQQDGSARMNNWSKTG